MVNHYILFMLGLCSCCDVHAINLSRILILICFQGAKDNTPALSMVVLEEGWYAVDFHAQLSTLQAFSICVAILHGTETSVARQEKRMQLPHCNSLKMIIEEEVKFLIEAVTEEEKKKVTRRMEESPPPYVINPPFSPMSRV